MPAHMGQLRSSTCTHQTLADGFDGARDQAGVSGQEPELNYFPCMSDEIVCTLALEGT